MTDAFDIKRGETSVFFRRKTILVSSSFIGILDEHSKIFIPCRIPYLINSWSNSKKKITANVYLIETMCFRHPALRSRLEV